MEQISKGIVKGGINTFELFIGLLVGINANNIYSQYFIENKEEFKKSQYASIKTITFYILIMVSMCFITREFCKLLFKGTIMSTMDYDKFVWPEPVMFGFGMMFFQDSLKEHIKLEFEKFLINQPHYVYTK